MMGSVSDLVWTGERRSTPTAVGYLLAVGVSIGVAAILLAVLWASERNVQGIAAALLVSLVYVTVLAIPVAPVGVLLVHLCCRRTDRQGVHVLAAGLAGVLAGLAFGALVSGVPGAAERLDLALVLGVAAATGRAAVIPLRPARPRPVDNDFVPGRRAC